MTCRGGKLTKKNTQKKNRTVGRTEKIWTEIFRTDGKFSDGRTDGNFSDGLCIRATQQNKKKKRLQVSYGLEKLTIWRKISRGIIFWRQKKPSSSKICRKRRIILFSEFAQKIFRCEKIDFCKLSETRFAKVWARSDRSSGGKRKISVCSSERSSRSKIIKIYLYQNLLGRHVNSGRCHYIRGR